ncbi:MAG: ATP-binding protein, partial [Pseudomonadota bacterium]|nr:ATP-binding protein [Pseudomonadota bacterium]
DVSSEASQSFIDVLREANSRRDTGVGIAPEHLARIFDEFARLRNPEHDPNKGWGFGLTICRRLVKVISGAITVENQPNRGSIFTVRLAASCVVNRSAGSPNQAGCETRGAKPA